MDTQSSDNQRQSYRYPIADAQKGCTLRIGPQALPGVLLNESVGGFAVLVGRQMDLAAAQVVELRTGGGWFIAEVTRVEQISRPEQIASFMASEPGPWFQVGLRRRNELPVDSPAMSGFTNSLQNWVFERMPSSGTLIVLGAVLVVAMVVVPVGFSLVSWYAKSLRSDAGSHKTEWTSAKDAAFAKPPLPPRTSTDANFSRSGGKTRKPASTPKYVFDNPAPGTLPWPTTTLSRDRCTEVRRMPGATALILPDVVADLQLTPQQQGRIRQIVDETDGLILEAESDAKSHDLPQEEIARQRNGLFNASRRKAMRVLTKEQRAKWGVIIR